MSSDVQKKRNELLIFIPAIITFCLVLIPTINYSVPLSSETFLHGILIQFYADKGLSWGNNIILSGQAIYSPLFDFFLLSVSKIFTVSYLTAARALQPVFAFLVILSFSFIAFKLYNVWTGLLTGIFVMFSAFFYKIMFTTPETMFLIIVPLIAYFYCRALESENFKYALLSGILLGIGFLTQGISAAVILFVITIFTLTLIIIKRKHDLKFYGILLGTSLLIAALWWLPFIINGSFAQGMTIPAYIYSIISINNYSESLGVIPLVFAFIGALFFIKRAQINDILLMVWLVILVLLSLIQFTGVPIGAQYILLLAIFPLTAMAGVGVQCIRIDGDKRPIYALTALILIFGVYYGYGVASSVQPEYNEAQLESAQWLKNHVDKSSIFINNKSTMDSQLLFIDNKSVPTVANSLKISEI